MKRSERFGFEQVFAGWLGFEIYGSVGLASGMIVMTMQRIQKKTTQNLSEKFGSTCFFS